MKMIITFDYWKIDAWVLKLHDTCNVSLLCGVQILNLI